MASVASIPPRYSSVNRSNLLVKTGSLALLNDIFVRNEVLVIQSYLYMPMDDISTLTSDVPSVVRSSNLILIDFGYVVDLSFSLIDVSSIIDKSNIRRWRPITVGNDSIEVDWNDSCKLHMLPICYSLVCGLMRVKMSVQLAAKFAPFICVATSIRAITAAKDPLWLVTIV